MKLRRVMVFSTGLTIGYLAGTAAGRERFEQIRSGAAAVAADLGLTRVSQQLRLRTSEVARASVDVAAETACDGIDTAADRLEALMFTDHAHRAAHLDTHPASVPTGLVHANGSPQAGHKGKKHG